jgi:hypothetical protein
MFTDLILNLSRSEGMIRANNYPANFSLLPNPKAYPPSSKNLTIDYPFQIQFKIPAHLPLKILSVKLLRLYFSWTGVAARCNDDP